MKSQSTQVVNANILDWAKDYDGPPFHAILCDPPYNYAFMGKDWDDAVAMHPETWEALAAHLLPGAFIMAFGGARTYHRLAVAMEDAGLVIHSAMGWLNGQGFPKSTRINRNGNGHNEWDGHRYGKQSIKPALEMICLAQVPYSGKPIDSITATGAGALNIDGGRIDSVPRTTHSDGNHRSRLTSKGVKGGAWGNPEKGGKWKWDGTITDAPQGRWPANFALVHAAGCKPLGTRRVGSGQNKINDGDSMTPSHDGYCRPNASMYTHKRDGKLRAYGEETVAAWDCVDGCPVKALGEQGGVSVSAGGTGPTTQSIGGRGAYQGGDNRGFFHYGDKGSRARFYHNADWQHEVAERLAVTDSVRYQAKVSPKEKSSGLRDFCWRVDESTRIGFVRIGRDEWEQLPKKERVTGNVHPTCKPIGLTKWLATLLLPPPEYGPRRIWVPFSGSGSEMIGAYLAGWDKVVGIELEADYCKIADARLLYWSGELLRGWSNA